MQYNKVMSVSDYKDLVRHEPPLHRKEWEIEMALATLRDHGATGPDKIILGAGAGHEATIYHLSNEVEKVVATDLYLNPGIWGAFAVTELMDNPAKFAPPGVKFNAEAIVVEHADMCNLQYADDSFDGIFSSGSIEHVGTLDDVARAAKELGRVLKPGGVLSLSTEFLISGKGYGWPGVLLLNREQLMDYIVMPSGCEMIDELVEVVDEDTLKTVWPLDRIVLQNRRPDLEAVLSHGPFTFTSVHLALIKPKRRRRGG